LIAAYGPAVLEHCLIVAGLSPYAKIGKDIKAANGIDCSLQLCISLLSAGVSTTRYSRFLLMANA
jgi:hypothetical protein